jgi:ankyrin repeat protein
VEEELASGVAPQQVTESFWQACHGGQLETAELLLSHGAELDWVGWDGRTSLDIATEQGATGVADWLRSRGGKSAAELPAPL